MKFHLKVWRQKNPKSPGKLEEYEANNIPEDASFLEMLDIGADLRADRVFVAGAAGRRADGAVQQRGAEAVEKTR